MGPVHAGGGGGGAHTHGYFFFRFARIPTMHSQKNLAEPGRRGGGGRLVHSWGTRDPTSYIGQIISPNKKKDNNYWSIYVFICLSIYVSYVRIYSCILMFNHLSIFSLYLCIHIYVCIYLFNHWFIDWFIDLFIHLCIYLFIDLSIFYFFIYSFIYSFIYEGRQAFFSCMSLYFLGLLNLIYMGVGVQNKLVHARRVCRTMSLL